MLAFAALAALDGVVGLTVALAARPGRMVRRCRTGRPQLARPVSADTPFWWASAGKAFTATAILQAVQAGTLRLDDRIDAGGRPTAGRVDLLCASC